MQNITIFLNIWNKKCWNLIFSTSQILIQLQGRFMRSFIDHPQSLVWAINERLITNRGHFQHQIVQWESLDVPNDGKNRSLVAHTTNKCGWAINLSCEIILYASSQGTLWFENSHLRHIGLLWPENEPQQTARTPLPFHCFRVKGMKDEWKMGGGAFPLCSV